ncbi:MAG: hypothetical protein KDB94_01480, partial [Acidobacteria bacterium]|nr:hypothetical protein [Acidobacteriota bacterium]
MWRRLFPVLVLVVAPSIAGAEGAPYLVQDTSPGIDLASYYGGVSSLRPLGDRLLFVGASDESLGVWSLEPGTRSAELLSAAEDGFAFASEGAGFLLWFDHEPWDSSNVTISDGSPTGTFEAVRGPYRHLEFGIDPHLSASLGGLVLFRGYDPSAGWEPWITDGTAAGTRLLVDLEPGTRDSLPLGFRNVGPRICFRAATQFDGAFLACSDGTLGGTNRVTPLDLELTYVDRAAVAGNQRLVFAVEPGGSSNSTDLYATAGTLASTVRILDLPAEGRLVSDLYEIDGRVYFVADDVVHGQELWVTDGTPSGTRRISEFGYATPFLYFRGREDIVTSGQNVVFFATDGLSPATLWRSNGNPASTMRAVAPRAGCDGPAYSFANVGSRIAFAERCDGSGYELRALDLVTGAVVVLFDACAGECDGDPSRPTRVGPFTLFEAGLWDERELYVTDGTPAGTWRISSVSEGGSNAGSPPWLPVWQDDRIWFPGKSSVTGLEIYSTGLDPSTTRLETNLVSGANSSDPFLLAPVGDGIAYLRCNGYDVVISSSLGMQGDVVDLATVSGPCYDLAEFGRVLLDHRALFVRNHPTSELWSTDGTVGGTSRLLQDLDSWGTFAQAQGSAWWLRFGSDRTELWRSDGTSGGTRFAAAVPPNLRALRTEPVAADGLVFFAAEDEDYEFRVVVFDAQASHFEVLPPFLARNIAEHQHRSVFVHTEQSVYFLGSDSSIPQLWRFDLGTHAPAPPIEIPDLDVSLVGANGWALLLFRELDSSMTLSRTNGDSLLALGTLGHVPEDGTDLADLPSPEAIVAGPWLLFQAQTLERGLELWATNGTPSGTLPVPEPWPGPASSVPSRPVVVGNAAYFAATDPSHGREVFRLDLVTGVQSRLSDTAPGARSSQVRGVEAAGDKLFFDGNDGLHGSELWAMRLDDEGCSTTPRDLCLNQSRFQVSAFWRDFFGTSGDGAAVPLTSDTGYFWFFDEANVETVLKVLDAIGVNQRYWVFYGALSNVEYTLDVFDSVTRIKRRYNNPPGRYASVGDVDAFDPFGLVTAPPFNEIETSAVDGWPLLVDSFVAPEAGSGSCVPDERRLCLQEGRFAVETSWRDFQGNTGVGTAVALSADTGYFWFFVDTNVEAILKVLDGRPVNDRFWVYYGALSNVEYTLTVTDTLTGAVK